MDELCKRSKEKGILIHLFADAQGIPLSAFSAPADEDERKHAEELFDIVDKKKTQAACLYEEISKISSRRNFLTAPEKVPAARRAMGKIAGLFRCFSLFGSLFYVGATISGIG